MPTTYRVTGDIFNVEDTLRFLHSDEKNSMNFFPLPVMFWRDVTKGKSHASVVGSAGFGRRRSLRLQPRQGNFLDEILVERIAAGDKVAMQARFKALSARRRRTDAELDKTIETTVVFKLRPDHTADEQVEAVVELTQSALDSLGLKPGMIKPL